MAVDEGASDAWGPPESRRSDDPFSVDESVRYERGFELGRGGMGRVVVARDRRLGRQVALKEVRPGVNQRAADAHLVAEAQLAAGLDHPGILAIHDAGRDAGGQPWYAMRLVRGQTLTQAARALRTVAERLRLMQPLLAVCHAVAHAHERKIIHRDIKPDNLLVGPHGETQVADWGLACTLEEAATGGVVGTVGFMAPEVARGQPASPRSDVYSLGATLVCVLHGALADADLQRLATSLPSELAAIADRCLAADPQRRYPDAAALAEDLSAWIDGRRVAAHSYSALQLAARLVRAFRVPLIVAAVAMIIVAGVAFQGYRRTVNQRDRAIAAEQSTRTAQTRAEQLHRTAQKNLAAAYVQAAESADAAGATPEAETLAAAAVALSDAPAARGILARLADGPAVTLKSDAALPSCRRLRFSPEGKWLLCITDNAALLLSGEAGSLKWQRSGNFLDGAISSAADKVLLIKREDYEGAVLALDSGVTVYRIPAIATISPPLAQQGTAWVAVATGQYVELRDLAVAHSSFRVDVCSLSDPLSALTFTSEPGVLLGTCRSGRLSRIAAGRAAQAMDSELPLLPKGDANALAITSTGKTLLGAMDGRLWAGGRELTEWSLGIHRAPPSVQSLYAGPEGTLAALGGGLGPVVWSQIDAKPTRLPIRDRVAVAFVDTHTIAAAGERLRHYTLRPRQYASRFVASSGLAEVVASPDARFLVAGGGDGTLTVWHSSNGEIAAHLKLTAGVVKSVAFSPDGQLLAVGMSAEPGFALLQVGSWQPLPVKNPVKVKSLGFFSNGMLWRNTYENCFDVLDSQGVSRRVDESLPRYNQGETGANVTQTAVVYYSSNKAIRLLDQRNPLHTEVLLDVPWVVAVALSADGRTVAVAESARIRLLDVASRSFVREIADPGQRIVHVAFSPDDRLIFATEIDGAVRVWRVADGAEVAVLRGHTQRVSRVLFGPLGLGLLTASWDGTIQRWDASQLVAPPDALIGRVAAHWGLQVEEALRFPVR